MAKLCFYSISTELGGAERSLLEFLLFLRAEKRHELEVLVPKASGPLLTELEAEDIPYTVLPMPAALLSSSRHGGGNLRALPEIIKGLAFYLPKLVRHFQNAKADIVYTTGIKCHLLGGIASLFTGVSLAWHLRDYFSPGATRFALRALALVLPRLAIVANSEATRLSFSRKRKISVVYNGVRAEEFSFSRSSKIRDELGLSSEKKIIGIVAVLARWKGQESFLQMAQLILRTRQDAHFVVIGDQIYDTDGDQNFRARLHQLVDELGIGASVSFLGFRRDNTSSIQSLDILVHASVRPEPFGRTIIEAMACGTPVTASAAGGPLEILESGVTGLLHSPGDAKAMADNVLRLLEDPIQYEGLRVSARRRFTERFTHERYNRDLSRILADHRRASTLPKSSATA